ncbi:hypothetical protein BR1R3_37500 [Pseudomonas atacamensis]|nr:hypothetical protein BR1R3_37500 [Pseudomonas atacamensis]
MQAHFGARRNLLDVRSDALGEADVARVEAVNQFKPMDREVCLLAQTYAWSPIIPPAGTFAYTIEGGSDKSDGDRAFVGHAYLIR